MAKGMAPYIKTAFSVSELSAMLYVPVNDVPVMFFSSPLTVTCEAKVWSAIVITWFAPIVKATSLMVKEGITKLSFVIFGRVMFPVEALVISNFTVSLAVFTSVVNTCAVEAPAKFNVPCICAIILFAIKVAKTSVKNFFM